MFFVLYYYTKATFSLRIRVSVRVSFRVSVMVRVKVRVSVKDVLHIQL